MILWFTQGEHIVRVIPLILNLDYVWIGDKYTGQAFII